MSLHSKPSKYNNMRNLLVIALTSTLLFSSCTKEEDCTCGEILNDGIDNGCYWLEIRNDCTGNRKQFCFDQSGWTDAFVGTDFCVTGETW